MPLFFWGGLRFNFGMSRKDRLESIWERISIWDVRSVQEETTTQPKIRRIQAESWQLRNIVNGVELIQSIKRWSCKLSLLPLYRPIAQLVERWSPKPGVGGSSPSWPAIKRVKMEKPEKFLKVVKEFFRSAKVELDKVIFPTKIQVRQAFVAVILVVTVISIFLAIVDMLMPPIVSY